MSISLLIGIITFMLYMLSGEYIKEISSEPKDALFELFFILAFIYALYPIYIIDKLIDIVGYKKV